jgi:hypothetical protein
MGISGSAAAALAWRLFTSLGRAYDERPNEARTAR